MTCIVGIVEGNKVYMGADSAGSNTVGQLTIRKDKKLFRNGDFLIGCTSSFRMIQLLQYSFKPPVCETEDVSQYMATTFIDAVRECFKNGGYAQKFSEQEYAGEFLVGYKGHLFHIDRDYQVGESIADHDAVGSGSDVALGALFATPNIKTSKRIETALQASERYNTGVRAPFHFEELEAA